MITISEDYWQGSGWTSQKGKEIEGYWEGKGWEGPPALKIFGEKLQDMKDNHPSAYNAMMYNLEIFKSETMESSGISSAINRMESAFTAGLRVGIANLSFLIGKAAATNPLLADFQNFLTQMTHQIERITQENWVGSSIGALLGAAVSTYYIGNPQVGSMFGGFLGAWLEHDIKRIMEQWDKVVVQGEREGFPGWKPPASYWVTPPPSPHDREPPPRDPIDIARNEVESMKKYIRRYNLI